jgi:hypothetical protein
MQIPKFLKDTKAIINIQNTDNKCFLWSVLRSIHMNKKNNERYADLKQYKETINMFGIEYPVKHTSFEQFEKQNTICINVYAYTNNKKNPDEKPFIYPIYKSTKNTNTAINLLFLQDKTKDESHYCLINNFNKLNSVITKHKCKKLFCVRCCSCFSDSANKKDKITGKIIEKGKSADSLSYFVQYFRKLSKYLYNGKHIHFFQ